MKINPPEIIREYIEKPGTVPLVAVRGGLWYSITEEEKTALLRYAADLESIPRATWEALSDSEKWALSSALNNAERIAKNCIIRGEA